MEEQLKEALQIKHEISTTIQKLIDKSVNKQVLGLLQGYENVVKQFGKFFNQEGLADILNKKAENSRVDLCLLEKANNKDLDRCYSIIEQLYARIRQLSILVLEVSRALVPQRSSSSMVNVETIQAKISKHEYLIKLSELTLKDIVHFSNWIT